MCSHDRKFLNKRIFSSWNKCYIHSHWRTGLSILFWYYYVEELDPHTLVDNRIKEIWCRRRKLFCYSYYILHTYSAYECNYYYCGIKGKNRLSIASKTSVTGEADTHMPVFGWEQRITAKETVDTRVDVIHPDRIIICDDWPITLKWDAAF